MQQHLAIHTKDRDHILSLFSQRRAKRTACPADDTLIVPQEGCLGSLDRVGISTAAGRRSPHELVSDETLHIKGWAAAKDPDVPFDALFFVLDGTRWLPVAYGLPRRDAAALRSDGSLRQTGFDELLSMRHIALGEHTLAIVGLIKTQYRVHTSPIAFTVLVRPDVVDVIEADQIERPGRVRILRDTLLTQRDDGRSDEAIRPGASLVVAGWTLAADGVNIPETTRVLLASGSRTYRAMTSSAIEPEAGIAHDRDAVHAGYRTWIDCTPIVPGLYQVILETCLRGVWTLASTKRFVEIMRADGQWLPAALPTYAQHLPVSFDVPLPTVLVQGASFMISGRLNSFEPILGAFVRFDGEQTLALTTSPHDPDAPATTFGCLCRPRLALGNHLLEIFALDRLGSGMHLIASTTLRVEMFPMEAHAQSRLSATHFAEPWAQGTARDFHGSASQFDGD